MPADLNPQRIGVARIKPSEKTWFEAQVRMGNSTMTVSLHYGDDEFFSLDLEFMQGISHCTSEHQVILFQPISQLLAPDGIFWDRRYEFEESVRSHVNRK
jgi:hypothetical protein